MNSASPDKRALNKYHRWVESVHCPRLSRLIVLRQFTLAGFSWIGVGQIDANQRNVLAALIKRILAALPDDDDVWEPPISGYFPTLPGGQRYHH